MQPLEPATSTTVTTEEKNPLHVVKNLPSITSCAHPFGCAARSISSTRCYVGRPGEFIRDFWANSGYWPSSSYLVPFIIFMEATSDGDQEGPGEKIAQYIEQHSLGTVLRSGKKENPGHGANYRNQAFIWSPEKTQMTKWAEVNVPRDYYQQVKNLGGLVNRFY